MTVETTVATGVATGGSPEAVASAAAADALSDLEGDRVDFCQAFCSASLDTEAAVAAIREVIGDEAALIGCTSTGEFTEADAVHDGVALGLVTSDSIQFHTGIGRGLSENLPRAVREALASVPDAPDGHPYRSAINLHDGLQGVGEQLALVTQRKLGPQVQFAGGAASDRYELESTRVVCDDEVASDAVVLAVMDSTERPVLTVDHGHEPISGPMEVTAASGNVVEELNGRPAYEVYSETVREPARDLLDIDIEELAPGTPAHTKVMGVFEFGIDQGEDYKIRWPRVEDPDPDAGTITFAVDMPEGTVLRVMQGRVEDQIDSARRAARTAHDLAEGEYAGGFVYDCACREIILEEEFPTAVAAMADELAAPFAGFETYGELCMEMGQMSGFHNTTSVIQLFPK